MIIMGLVGLGLRVLGTILLGLWVQERKPSLVMQDCIPTTQRVHMYYEG